MAYISRIVSTPRCNECPRITTDRGRATRTPVVSRGGNFSSRAGTVTIVRTHLPALVSAAGTSCITKAAASPVRFRARAPRLGYGRASSRAARSVNLDHLLRGSSRPFVTWKLRNRGPFVSISSRNEDERRDEVEDEEE